MESMPQNIIKSEHQDREKNISMTTLYELLEAIEEEIKPEEDWMVSEIVLNLFNSGKIRASFPQSDRPQYIHCSGKGGHLP